MSFDTKWWTTGRHRIHLIGAAGSGMTPLAEILLDLGHEVTGSDLKDGGDRLKPRGFQIRVGHSADAVGSAEAVVASAAIREDNPEWAEAKKRGIARFRRGEVLAKLAAARKLVAILGSHGKTTTATMLAQIWREAGEDPSFYLGGFAPSLGASGAWRAGSWLIAEVDESEGAPSQLQPWAALLLNADHEHADRYPDGDAVVRAYREVLGQVVGPVVVVAREEDAAMKAAVDIRAKVTFGWEKSGADYVGTWQGEDAEGLKFGAQQRGKDLGSFRVAATGRHNAGNALGALALAQEAGLATEKIRQGLQAFRRADRRFEILCTGPELEVVDDYAHHPREVVATIEAARARGRARLVAVFQPHRYTRMATFLAGFADALAFADVVVLLPVYAAGEKPIEGRGLVQLAAQLKGKGAREADLFLKVRKTAAGEGDVRWYEPMQKHTTIRIGGPAQVWFEPENEDVLGKVVRLCEKEKVCLTLVGRGSNLLVRDGGIPGVCVHLGRPGMSGIEAVGGKIRAGAGARLKQLVAVAKDAWIGGLEFMEGIPGALGGAMRMNAGAMESWTFGAVESVRVMDRTGKVKEVPGSEFEVKYRKVPRLVEEIAVGAVLKGQPVKPEEIAERLKKYSRKRWDSQPAAPSAGCIFKNAESIPAGKLIEELGLKDTAVGGARISPVHGNFIVNQGGAKATDVLALMEKVRARARMDRGIELESEVIVLGEDE
ncbi:MAG: UDP-N-acetylmuramate--L-alanine ligase [Verrucomicrobia bacterium]|nr:UDP-N-acetylmuramate--L-alanine ligase [Verrucomicrobiota bacterium]